MATKRKPKSEPIMNAEPLKSDGVIVTHRDRHITPGNASVTWLVVMMAIIGVAGAFCTYIWWQKEDLSAQIEAPYMHDNGSIMSKVVRGMREKMEHKPEPVMVMETLDSIGAFPLGYQLTYPQSLDVRIDFPDTNSDLYSVSWNHGPFIYSQVTRQESILMNHQEADKKVSLDAFITKEFGSKIKVEDLRTEQGVLWKDVTIIEEKEQLWRPSHAFALAYKDKDGKDQWLILEVNKLSSEQDFPIAQAMVQSLKLTDASTQ